VNDQIHAFTLAYLGVYVAQYMIMIEYLFANPKDKSGGVVLSVEPSDEDIGLLVSEHNLDRDMILDGIDQHESPRIDRYHDATYIYTRYCLEEKERNTTMPVLLVYGDNYIFIILKQAAPWTKRALDIDKLSAKRTRTLLQLMLVINSGFRTRINQTSRRIWKIRGDLKHDNIDTHDFITFIDIEEDLNDYLLALEPMNTMLNSLLSGKYFKLYDDDRDLIEDIELGTEELTVMARSMLNTLKNIREAYSTMAASNLNKVFKLMTSVTILMSIFTLVTGIYSMNVALPGRDNANSFWIITGVALVFITGMAIIFKRKKWF
jgi:magnesium transporter